MQLSKEELAEEYEHISEEITQTEKERLRVMNQKVGPQKIVDELTQKNRDLLSKRRKLEEKQKELKKALVGKMEIYQSRWGYHSCSYHHYMKIKQVRSNFYAALQVQAQWERWNRKATWNRYRWYKIRNEKNQPIDRGIIERIEEPPRCPIFSRTTPASTNVFQYWKTAHMYREHPDTQRTTFVDDMGILAEFERAQPKERIIDVEPMKIPEDVLDKWLEEHTFITALRKKREKNVALP